MATILTDADVFGTSPKAAQPRTPQTPGAVLNDSEVFGGAPTPEPIATTKPARKPRSDASIALGGIGAGTKAVARNVADFADMLLSVPGMAMGSVADVVSRVQSFAEGADPKAAGRIAKEVRQGVTMDFSPTVLRQLTEAAISAVAPDKQEVDATDIQKSMELITHGIEKGGKWVERKTGGVISAETFDSLVAEGMAIGGVKGTAIGAGKAGKALAARADARQPVRAPVEPTLETPPTKTPAGPNEALLRQVEEITGVAASRQTPKQIEARQKQARDAFKDDAAYADRQAGFAETEAAMRASAPPALSAPGGMAQTGPRAPRTGSRDAILPPELPPARTAPIDTGAVPSLDSALAKVREGKSFDLTAAERIALRDVRSQFGAPQIVDAQGKPVPRSQRGATSQELNSMVATLGLGTALALYAYYNQDDLPETIGAAAGMIGARGALGPALRESGYTLKTLERLPQNKTEFTREQVMQQVNRADVTKAEKDLVMAVLGEKQSITAKELLEGFRKEGEGLELRPKNVDEYADYGLDNIGRRSGREYVDALDEIANESGVPARTTIYRNKRLNDTNNHFDDPKYFAHARSFDEGGVRHVVELQSDVAQHVKQLTPEQRVEAQTTYERLNRMAATAERAQDTFNDTRSTIGDYVEGLKAYESLWQKDVVYDIKLRLGEKVWERIGLHGDHPLDSIADAAARRGDYDLVYDYAKAMLERADTRARSGKPMDTTYIQQLADAFEDALYKESKLIDLRAEEARARLGGGVPEETAPLLKNWYKRLVREEIRQAGGAPVRFATADTVAKVEGWPQNDYWSRQVDILKEKIREYEADGSTLPKDHSLRGELAAAEQLAVEHGPNRFSPQHKGIYDRYKGDVEKFLKNELGAKEVTDSQGHTWLEVAPQPKGPVRMFGRAGVKEMAALAALSGAALATDIIQGDDPSLALDALVGGLAATATLGRPRTALAIGAGSGLAAFLSSEEKRAGNAALTGAVLGVLSFAKSKNKTIAKWASDSSEAAEVVAGNLSAELRKMSPPLLRRFTQHERNLKIREHDAMVRISGLAEGLIKLPRATQEAIDVALFNGERGKALKLMPPELAKEARKAFDYIDETGAKLDSLGLVKKLNKEHFPRIVSDLDGLMAALGQKGGDVLGRKLVEAQTDNLRRTGAPLSDIEMSRVVNEHLQAAINQSDLGGQSGILKKRSIEEITKQLLPFYAPAADSIALYARAASREIERANFFGRDLIKSGATRAVNVPGSIGQLVARERQAGRLNRQQLQRLESILKARFGPGERSGHWLTQSYKNLVYTALLGNPLSALVQFGDAAVAVAVHGMMPAINALAQTVSGKAKWHLADQGLINHISEDLVLGSRDPLRMGQYEITSAKFLDKMLKYSGFSFVDEFSKMIHLNAAANKFEKLAKSTKGVLEIERNYGDYFGADLPQLLVDLRQGKKSPLVGELVFRELSDTQPISKLEMPQGYLQNPNGRVLYTLKSFMLKQLNLVRERGVREIAKGDPASVAKGVNFLLRYGLALGLSGATISMIQDWILGREPSFEMADVAENVFKAFGWGEYAINQARKGKLLQSAANLVVPPYKLFEEMWAFPEQLEKFEQGDPKANPKGAMYIPLVGKLIYNRMLGGAERADARKERERARREREERGY